MNDTDRAIPLLEAVVASRAARIAPRVAEAFDARPTNADWEPRHRLAFAHYSLANSLIRAHEWERAKASAELAHGIWKRLVEEDGFAHLGKYQYDAMFQVAKADIQDADFE